MEFLEKTRGRQNHKCQKCGSTDLEKLLSGFAVGQGKSDARSCETCAGGPCYGNSCPSGSCPMP